MSNFYVDLDYVITDYIFEDIATINSIYPTTIGYTVIDSVSSIIYNFSITNPITHTPTVLTSNTTVTLEDGKKFIIPSGKTEYSIEIPKIPTILKIEFETSPSITNINNNTISIGDKKVELVETIIRSKRYRSIVIKDSNNKLSTLSESIKVTLTTGEVFYLSDLNRKATVSGKINGINGITNIFAPDIIDGNIASVTSVVDNHFTFQTRIPTEINNNPKTIYHSNHGTESVEKMSLNVGSLVFDTGVDLTGKVYYKIDNDILTVNKIAPFKNIRELFDIKDLRKK